MLSVHEAFAAIQQEIPELWQAKSRVIQSGLPEFGYLVGELVADRDFPPFDRVAMDGIAIAFSSYQAGCRTFTIESLQFAGSERKTLRNPRNSCIEVMTGAILPLGCDTVIRYEDLHKSGELATVLDPIAIQLRQNVHRQGSDRRKGEVLVGSGSPMLAPQWAVAATVGASEVPLAASPTLSILATGDELVAIDQTPFEHQIRASNITALTAALRHRGFHAITAQLVSDDPKELTKALEKALSESQLCILTGAVSMGLHDHVPRTLKDLGVREVFHKIRQRPGKPLWFGKSAQNTLVFGLPGNPVSSLVCLYRYVLPILYQMQGVKTAPPQKFAQLTESISFPLGDHMSLFTPVSIYQGEDAVVYAKPVRGIGSGDLAGLADSDGFLECPEGRTEFQKGQVFPLYPWGLI